MNSSYLDLRNSAESTIMNLVSTYKNQQAVTSPSEVAFTWETLTKLSSTPIKPEDYFTKTDPYDPEVLKVTLNTCINNYKTQKKLSSFIGNKLLKAIVSYKELLEINIADELKKDRNYKINAQLSVFTMEITRILQAAQSMAQEPSSLPALQKLLTEVMNLVTRAQGITTQIPQFYNDAITKFTQIEASVSIQKNKSEAQKDMLEIDAKFTRVENFPIDGKPANIDALLIEISSSIIKLEGILRKSNDLKEIISSENTIKFSTFISDLQSKIDSYKDRLKIHKDKLHAGSELVVVQGERDLFREFIVLALHQQSIFSQQRPLILKRVQHGVELQLRQKEVYEHIRNKSAPQRMDAIIHLIHIINESKDQYSIRIAKMMLYLLLCHKNSHSINDILQKVSNDLATIDLEIPPTIKDELTLYARDENFQSSDPSLVKKETSSFYHIYRKGVEAGKPPHIVDDDFAEASFKKIHNMVKDSKAVTIPNYFNHIKAVLESEKSPSVTSS